VPTAAAAVEAVVAAAAAAAAVVAAELGAVVHSRYLWIPLVVVGHAAAVVAVVDCFPTTTKAVVGSTAVATKQHDFVVAAAVVVARAETVSGDSHVVHGEDEGRDETLLAAVAAGTQHYWELRDVAVVAEREEIVKEGWNSACLVGIDLASLDRLAAVADALRNSHCHRLPIVDCQGQSQDQFGWLPCLWNWSGSQSVATINPVSVRIHYCY